MDIQEIIDKMHQKKYLLGMGAGKLSKWFNTDRDTIYRAKSLTRKKLNRNRLPKILVFDIETSPTISYTWGRFKENITIDKIEQDPIMLTWAAKWLFNPEVISDAITPKEVLKFNDYRIVKSLWDIIDEADILIAHYGSGFDIPFLNYRAIVNGLNPPHTSNSIDTKKESSKTFKFPSNKLDALASYFEIEGKFSTNMSLWINCLKGNSDSIKEMLDYNIQDVIVLEKVYLRLRPWIKGHINTGLYIEEADSICPSCGSKDIKLVGDYYTQTGKYTTYRCKCGALSRERKSNYIKEFRQNLLTGVSK